MPKKYGVFLLLWLCFLGKKAQNPALYLPFTDLQKKVNEAYEAEDSFALNNIQQLLYKSYPSKNPKDTNIAKCFGYYFRAKSIFYNQKVHLYNQAVKCSDSAIFFHKVHFPQELSMDYYVQAQCYTYLNQPLQAIQSLEKAKEITANDADIYKLLSDNWNKLGDYEKALNYNHLALIYSNPLENAALFHVDRGRIFYFYGQLDSFYHCQNKILSLLPKTENKP
ncbi:MAG: tetratricopeptide repeat protein, partial [Leadbetterella sp.]